MSKENLEKMILDKYISRRSHPSANIFILNYTPKCQYDWLWTRETIQCRGLIVDENDNVIARPWPKFFTTTQYADLRNKVHNLYGVKYEEMHKGPFTTTEKMDGNLGLLFWINGEPGIATRGSFESPQAKLATEIFREKYADHWIENIGIQTDRTYLFECILPAHRIVVDYKGMEDLILLDIIDNNNGESLIRSLELQYHHSDRRHTYGSMPRHLPALVQHHDFNTFVEVQMIERENAEGFVVHFHDSGIRVKIKHNEYLKLHKIMTGCTKRTIWEMLKNKEDVESLKSIVPSEFYNWINNTAEEFTEQFCSLKSYAILEAKYLLGKNISRRSMALELKDNPNSGQIFSVLDGKENTDKFNDAIWMSIRPPASTPWPQEKQK